MLVGDPGDGVERASPVHGYCVCRSRPALTLSARSQWVQDVPISNHQAAGLTAASIVRVKLFTLDNRLVSRKIGALSSQDRQSVRRILRGLLAV